MDASQDAMTFKNEVISGTRHMKELLNAMENINRNSREIQKILSPFPSAAPAKSPTGFLSRLGALS